MAANDINPVELDFLLRFPVVPNVTSPVDFMNNFSWGGIKASFHLSFQTFFNLCIGNELEQLWLQLWVIYVKCFEKLITICNQILDFIV